MGKETQRRRCGSIIRVINKKAPQKSVADGIQERPTKALLMESLTAVRETKKGFPGCSLLGKETQRRRCGSIIRVINKAKKDKNTNNKSVADGIQERPTKDLLMESLTAVRETKKGFSGCSLLGKETQIKRCGSIIRVINQKKNDTDSFKTFWL